MSENSTVGNGSPCRYQWPLDEDYSYDEELLDEIMTRKPSPELADIVGMKEATIAKFRYKIVEYIEKHDLIFSGNRYGGYFSPDKKMAKIFGNDKVGISMITDFISPHLFEIIQENDSKTWLDLITPVRLSDKLANFVGVQEASHVECIHKIWARLERQDLLRNGFKVRNVAKRYGL